MGADRAHPERGDGENPGGRVHGAPSLRAVPRPEREQFTFCRRSAAGDDPRTLVDRD
jgi:hypothetical protein